MKTILTKISAFAFVLLLVAAATSTGCKKDKTCHGKVKVIDTNGIGVGNATVKLAAPSVNGDVVYESVTDGSGDVSFEVKLPAIFDVTASKTGYGDGVGVLRLDEPGKSNEVTVKLQ